MDDLPIRLRPADAERIGYAVELLEEAGLPTDDVRATRDCFFVATLEGRRVGIAAIEAYGSDGLLRSVVVDAEERRQGIGSAICAALEREAREQGIERLYLLTTTAEDFFRSLGYRHIERTAAPANIRDTAQFTELCPDSAVCLMNDLDDNPVQDGS